MYGRDSLPALYEGAKQNDFRGDFLIVIGREEDGSHLLRSFSEHYNTTGKIWYNIRQ